jgi:hypothetical protein
VLFRAWCQNGRTRAASRAHRKQADSLTPVNMHLNLQGFVASLEEGKRPTTRAAASALHLRRDLRGRMVVAATADGDRRGLELSDRGSNVLDGPIL